jgi:hypothetical protein
MESLCPGSYCDWVQGKSPSDCWICGKPVLPENAGMDVFGAAVHAECQRSRTREKKPLPSPPKPKAN